MRITTRRRLFYFLVSIFLISGIYTFFYSQGIRFDPVRLAFVETGGMYISASPDTAEIILDEKHITTDNGIFRRGVFISNLLPGIHNLSVEKDGFFSYEKQILVRKGLVAQATNIILAPTTSRPTGSILSQQEEIIVFDDVKGVYFFRDSARGTLLNINLLFTNLKENELGLPGAVPITTTLRHPFNGQKLIIASTGAIYIIDIRRLAIELIHKGSATQIATNGTRLVWAEYDTQTKRTTVFRYDLLLNTLHTFPYTLADKSTELILSPSSQYAALRQSDGRLFLFTMQDSPPILLANNGIDPLFSYNSSLIAFHTETNGTATVYDIARDMTLSLPASSYQIRRIVWYRDSFHLFIQADDGVYFADIDDHSPLYAPRIATQADTIMYTPAENILTIQSADDGEWRAIDFNF